MTVLIIDGQGGRMGAALVESLRRRGCAHRLLAVGTNTVATAAMLKAGATEAATGENPVAVAARKADVIAGPMGIIAANSLLGEITPAMALAISESDAPKVLIPVNKCHITVAGVRQLPQGEYIEDAAALIMEMTKEK